MRGLAQFGPHGHLYFTKILENQTGDPASAGFFEGRQVWEVRCVVTMQEIRICAKFVLVDSSVLIQPGGPVQPNELLGCVVTMREVLNCFQWPRSTSDSYREQPRMNCNGL